MNKYRFLINQDGKEQIAKEEKLPSIESARKKLKELCDKYCDNPVPKEYVTTSKPCTTQILQWDEVQNGWISVS